MAWLHPRRRLCLRKHHRRPRGSNRGGSRCPRPSSPLHQAPFHLPTSLPSRQQQQGPLHLLHRRPSSSPSRRGSSLANLRLNPSLRLRPQQLRQRLRSLPLALQHRPPPPLSFRLRLLARLSNLKSAHGVAMPRPTPQLLLLISLLAPHQQPVTTASFRRISLLPEEPSRPPLAPSRLASQPAPQRLLDGRPTRMCAQLLQQQL